MSFLKQMIFSIARTFGRIIAYAIIAAIIAIVGSKLVGAQPQYRYSTGSWSNWTDLTLENNYQFATNTTTSWTSYIQLKDTTAFEANKTYNLYATFEVKLTQSGTREIFSAIDPYIYNGSTLTSVGDKCTITGTRSDKTTSSPLVTTTHTYKGSINCVGLKNTGYYPYLTLRFYSTVAVPTAFQFKIDKWEYHVGSDSTDANNIMNNANQNTQQIIESYNEATQNIIQNNIDIANNLVETIENQNKVCNDNIIYTLNNNNKIGDGYLDLNTGTIINTSNYLYSDYFRADSNYTTVLNQTNSTYTRICFYDENKTYISCEMTSNREITYQNPNNTFYIRLSTYGTNNVIATTTYCYDYREKETEESEKQTNLLVQIGQGILGLPDAIGNVFSDLLTYLFVPDDFDFSDEILSPLETKLGFIAQIPIQIITWMINLPNVNFDEFTGFTFPAFSFMDYSFWESQYIDITDIRDVIAPYKIYTSLTCVVICINTLYRHYHNFANGGE